MLVGVEKITQNYLLYPNLPIMLAVPGHFILQGYKTNRQ